MNEIPIQRWSSTTEYYDVATGEQITKTEFKNHSYIVVERHKHTTLNELKTSAHVKHTLLCKINPQLKLKL